MAKASNGNFFLKHVEKLVLAVCLVILAATVALYPMAQSTVDLDGQKMAPDKVDAYLVKLIDDMGKGAKVPPVQPEEDYLAILEKLKAPALTDPRFAMSDLAIPRPWIRPETQNKPGEHPLKLQDLVDLIPKPGTPLVIAASEYRATDPPSEVVAAHVTAVYPVVDLQELWQVAMKDSILAATVKIMDVNFERQEAQAVLANGTIVWGPSTKVEGVFRPARDKDGNETVVPTLPEVTENNSKEIQNAINDYFHNEYDKYKVEPDYWDVLGPQQQWLSWRINLHRTEVTPKDESGDVHPAAAPSVGPTTPGPSTVHPTGPGPGGGPGPSGPSVRPSGGAGVSPSGPGGKPKPGPVHTPVFVPPPAQPGAIKAAPIPVPVLPWALQMTNKAQVWVHDASLEYQKTYRYRAQLVLLSPLYGHMGEVKPPEDAKKLTIETPWSDWSDPVKPPPQAYLFLTGYAQQMKKVTVTVFCRCQGQLVSHTFDVKVGDVIGDKVIDVNVPDPKDPSKTIKKPCHFFTGFTLIDIIWDRMIFQNGVATKTVEIVLEDEQGNLVVLNLALDTASSEFKEMQAAAAKTAPVAAPIRPHPTTKPVRVPGGPRPPTH